MKKVTLLLVTLLIGGIMFTGCKKDQPTPTTKTVKIAYKVDNVQDGMGTASDCFTYSISYVAVDGKLITVDNIKLPWTSPEFEVTLPFDAKIEGNAIFNEEELPDQVGFGSIQTIFVNKGKYTNGNISFLSKDRFLEKYAANPDLLKFSYSKTLEAN